MSKVLVAVWENLYGLVVEDGQLAIGIVVSLAITWALTAYAGDPLHDAAGWVLLVLLIALTLANLYRAGQNAKRRVAQKGA
jgi:hypothetical protein